MSSRQRNLLEAFKDAGEALPAGSPSAGGPFAGPRRAPEESAAERPDSDRTRSDVDVPKASWSEVLEELPTWLPWALVGTAAFLLGLLVGRATASGPVVQAAPSGGDILPAGSDEVSAGRGARPAGADGRVRILPEEVDDPELRPLYDLDNEYAVVLITYGYSETGEGAAWTTHQFLLELGYPVFPPFLSLTNPNLIVLLAGASPTRADLKPLQAKIQRQKGPNGRDFPFATAYIDEIGDHFDLWRDG